MQRLTAAGDEQFVVSVSTLFWLYTRPFLLKLLPVEPTRRAEAMMRRNQAELARYNHALSVAVASSQGLADDFQGVCRKLRGAFPGDVARLLPADKANMGAEQIDVPEVDVLGSDAPEPHPIDYDWRFTGSTAGNLASLTVGFDGVLCLGTPSVFNAIARQGRQVHLVDRNPFLPRVLHRGATAHHTIKDIADIERIEGAFDAAVLDPPWYLPAYELWLSKAIPLLKPCASIFLILFRDLTRPDAIGQRASLLEKLAKVGTVSLLAEEAVYSTPAFEVEALRRLGLPPLTAWRIGDVIRVQLARGVDRWPFSQLTAHRKHDWSRFIVGRQVIAVATKEGDFGPISYQAPQGGAFGLDSVSSRDPRRSNVALWTSRNYAAVLSGTKRFAALLGQYADDAVPPPENAEPSLQDITTFHEVARDLRLGLPDIAYA